MRTTIVRVVALLIAVFSAYAAYRSNDPRLLLGTLFFGVMVFLSVRNAGAADSPYILFAFSCVFFFYSFTGLADGEYNWGRHSVAVAQNPQFFWSIFAATFLFGVVLLAYGYAQIKRRKYA